MWGAFFIKFFSSLYNFASTIHLAKELTLQRVVVIKELT
jgi:hypothetical protein